MSELHVDEFESSPLAHIQGSTFAGGAGPIGHCEMEVPLRRAAFRTFD